MRHVALLLLLAGPILAQDGLDRPVDLEFDDAPVAEVLAAISNQCGVAIDLDPEVEGSLTPDELARTVRLKGVPGRVALECVLDPDLAASFAGDRVRVRAVGLVGSIETEIFDVSDLADGGSLLGTVETPRIIDLLQQLVEENVEPGSWDPPNGIATDGMRLFVRHDDPTRGQVRRLLAQVREIHARPIEIEATIRDGGRVLARVATTTSLAVGRRIEQTIGPPDGFLRLDLVPILDSGTGTLVLDYRLDFARPLDGDADRRRHFATGIAPVPDDGTIDIDLGAGATATFRVVSLPPAPPAPDDPAAANERAARERFREEVRARTFAIDVAEVPLEDAVDVLREVSGFPIHVSPAVRQNFSIESTLLSESSPSTDAISVLDRFAARIGFTLRVLPGALLLTAGQASPGGFETRFHEIAGLGTRLGPIGPTPGALDPEPGATLRGIFREEFEASWCWQDEIEDLIQSNVRPEDWDQEGYALRNAGGYLLVTAPPRLQSEVGAFLSRLRPAWSGVRRVRATRFLAAVESLDSLPDRGPGSARSILSTRAVAALRGSIESPDTVTIHAIPGRAFQAGRTDRTVVPGREPATTVELGWSIVASTSPLSAGATRLAVEVRSARGAERTSIADAAIAVDLAPGQALLLPAGTAPGSDGKLEHVLVEVEAP